MGTPYVPNPQCPWVQAQSGTQVQVVAVDYVNADLSGGNLGIYVQTVGKKYPRWGVPFTLELPGSEDFFASYPQFKIDMAGGGFNPGNGERGPFKIVVGDSYVDGMGLPLNRHVIYIATFKVL